MTLNEKYRQIYMSLYGFKDFCDEQHNNVMRELEASLAAPEGERRFWVAVEDAMPQSGEIVLVSGGTAMHVDGVWYTGMEEPLFRRTINWPVTHWRPLPYYPQPQLLHPTKEKP